MILPVLAINFRVFWALLLLLLAACRPFADDAVGRSDPALDPILRADCLGLVPALIAAPDSAGGDPGQPPSDIRVETLPNSTILVQFTDAAGPHQLLCTYAGQPDAGSLAFAAVSLDGQAFDDRQLMVLRLWRDLSADAPVRLAPPTPPLAYGGFLIQLLINGLAVGAIYALIAAGYAIVFSLLELVNFAFGDICMIGAYACVAVFAVGWIWGAAPIPVAIALAAIAAILVTALVGALTERLVYRPLTSIAAARDQRFRRLPPMVAAIGLSILLQNLVALTQGVRSRWLPPLLGDGVALSLWGSDLRISGSQMLLVTAAGLVALLLFWILRRRGFGRALRATATDPAMAALLGVDIRGVVARAFMLASALAGLAGVLSMVHYGQGDPTMGLAIGFKGMTAAILGGIGSLHGAMLGGVLLGLFETLFAGVVATAYRDIAVFSILVITLVLLPNGLFGERDQTAP